MAYVDVPGLRKADGTQINPRQEDGHGSGAGTPSHANKAKVGDQAIAAAIASGDGLAGGIFERMISMGFVWNGTSFDPIRSGLVGEPGHLGSMAVTPRLWSGNAIGSGNLGDGRNGSREASVVNYALRSGSTSTFDFMRHAKSDGAALGTNGALAIVPHFWGGTEYTPVTGDPAKEATLDRRNNAFATLIHAQPRSTADEIRGDDIPSGALYIGRNIAGTATSATTWEVTKISRTTTGLMTRMQYKSGISWDDRAVAGNWS